MITCFNNQTEWLIIIQDPTLIVVIVFQCHWNFNSLTELSKSVTFTCIRCYKGHTVLKVLKVVIATASILEIFSRFTIVSIEASKQILFSFIEKLDGSIHESQNIVVMKKYSVFHQFFTRMDMFSVSKKKPKFLSNVQVQIMVVKFHLSYIPKQITLYQILRLLKRIWEKLYKILIQIKLMIICAKSIIMTLQIVYKLCLKKDYFPDR